MRRFFVNEIKPGVRSVAITNSEARHITSVLRMKPGDRIVLMDGKGARFQGIIESARHREVLVTLEKALSAPDPSPLEITLCQALLKSQSMDYVVQKTSELGVDHILPFLSERTVVKLVGDMVSHKLRHWRAIAVSAAKQSDRAAPAKISPLTPFLGMMERWKGEEASKIILWEEEGARDLRSLLRSSRPGKRVVGIVGPEGGFTPEEVKAAREAGFVSVSLGNRILRAETAAITLVALFQYEWGDLSITTHGAGE